MSDIHDEPESPELVGARLGRALALGEGFALYLVVVGSRTSALALASAAELAWSKLSGDRLPPPLWIDACAGREPFVELDPSLLRSNVYECLTSCPPVGTVWIDCTRAIGPLVTETDAVDGKAFGALFRLLNQQRNSLTESVAAPIIILGSAWLVRSFAEEAPDFWSLRTWTYEVDEQPTEVLTHDLVEPPQSRVESPNLERLSREVDELRSRLAANPDVHTHMAALASTLVSLGVLLVAANDDAAILQLTDAVALLEKLERSHPQQFTDEYVVALCALGGAYLSAGQPSLAISALAKAVDSVESPSLPEFWKHLISGQSHVLWARALVGLRQFEDATKHAHTALELLLLVHDEAPSEAALMVGSMLGLAGGVLCDVGDYPAALRAGYACLDAHRHHRDSELSRARALLLVARIEAGLERPAGVLAAAIEAGQLLGSHEPEDRETLTLRAASSGWMAPAYLAMGNVEDARAAARHHARTLEALAAIDSAFRPLEQRARDHVGAIEKRVAETR